MDTPAKRVIEKFGGHQALADALNIDVSRVYRWTYPKERGGTDGEVPAKQQRTLLDLARLRGIDLTPADFFGDPERAAS